jgi:hypothetical protein
MRNGAIWALVVLALGGGGLSQPSLARASAAAGIAVPIAQSIQAASADRIASDTALQVWTWVIASRDNADLPFIVIDKETASVLAFDRQGVLLGHSPALLGIARGDDATPGIGDRPLSEIGPAEKTTPAGRFLARVGPAKGYERVLWVDINTSVALHAVVTGNKKERRVERLQSPTPKDNRITFGCINVPASFYEDVVNPLFSNSGGLVYILPEEKFLIEAFPAFEIFTAPERSRPALPGRDD